MIRIRYTLMADENPTVVWLDGGTSAVAVEPYAHLDEGQGGITRGEIRTEDIKTLGEFAPGNEVFVEADDPQDVLDNTDADTERDSKIFWRARIEAK